MSQPATNAQPGSPAPVSFYEKRKKIYAKGIRGFFDNWRIALVIFTQLLFYVSPWLVWNDRQAILLHLVERKFYIFGLVFWPQDVIYLAALLIVSAYALFLVTAVAGRLFCGYACPQTVYTQIFMWIENWIEGDRNARMKLDKAPLDARKLRIKGTKHLLWGLFSLWTGFTLVAYFTPVSELIQSVRTGNLGAWEIFWSDERCLPSDHAGRNSCMAQDVWLSHVAIPAGQIHPIPAELGAARAAAEYTKVVLDRKPFDLVLLGMGEDGHTASLFSTSGDPIAPVIAVHGAPKPPAERVSLNFETLRACRKQLVLITGAEKSPALFAWQQGAQLPIAHAVRNDACLLADSEAGRFQV